MRIRSVKPGFWTSYDIAALPEPVALHFIGLWNYAQDNGVGRDDPRLIRSALYALRDEVGPEEIEQRQQTLRAAGLIVRYRSPQEVPLFYAPTWDAHQRINNPSRCPYARPTEAQIQDAARATVALPEPYGSPTASRGNGGGGGKGGEEGELGCRKGKGRESPNGPTAAVRRKAPGGASPGPETPLAQIHTAWAAALGPTPYGRLGKAFKPLLEGLGSDLPLVLKAIAAYGAEAGREGKPQFYTPEKFVASAALRLIAVRSVHDLTEAEARIAGPEALSWRQANPQKLTPRAKGVLPHAEP